MEQRGEAVCSLAGKRPPRHSKSPARRPAVTRPVRMRAEPSTREDPIIHNELQAPAESAQPATRAQWWVYILRCADDTLYTGVSNNLPARVKSHNAGRGARYTRSRRPVELVYQEAAADRGVAQQREYAIRKLNAQQKRALIAAALE